MMSKPLRILHVFHKLNRGGAETVIMNIYRNIDRKEIQFDFVVQTLEKCDYDDEIKNMGGHIYYIPSLNLKNGIKLVRAWRQFFKTHNEFLIIHGHAQGTATIYLSIAKKNRLKTIIHSHSTLWANDKFSRMVKNILQLPLRRITDLRLACSNKAGIALFGRKVEFTVINNAIESDKYIYNETIRTEMRLKMGLENKFVIGHVGNFTYPKNHSYLIDIFKDTVKRDSNVVLLLVGKGELEAEIRQKVTDFELSDNVIFAGSRSNIHELLQSMDLFVFPSHFEGLPLTVVEAQAAGLKCLISDNITNECAITPGVKFLSVKGSPNVWADEIIEIINGGFYKRESDLNAIINSGFDAKEQAKKMQRIYLQIASQC